MVKLVSSGNKAKVPAGDYVLDKPDIFEDIVNNLTPKFEGVWDIVLIDPKIAQVKNLLEVTRVPEWVNVIAFVNDKKINEICMEFPDLQPKKKTRKEAFDEFIAGLNHLVDKKTSSVLFSAYLENPSETEEVIKRLDKECESVAIPLSAVQANVVVSRRVYASEVVDAFLMLDKNRWKKFETLQREIGLEISYYAMYKYVKKLLSEKNKYLHNQNVKTYSVKKLDAPLICYAYTLFVNSHEYKQLPVILYALEHRCKESLKLLEVT